MSRRSPRRSSDDNLQYYQIRHVTLTVLKQWALLLNTPNKRRSNGPLRYYVKSLFTWHDETLNCWTNILSILLTAYATLQCTSTWAWYVGCMAVTTNICSLMAHMFTTVDFRTECIVFAFDLFGVIMLGSLSSMCYVGYAFSQPTNINFSSQTSSTTDDLWPPSLKSSSSLFLSNPNKTNFIKMALITQKILAMVLLVISIKRYKAGCLERWNKEKSKQKGFESSTDEEGKSSANQKLSNHDVISTKRAERLLNGARGGCTHLDTRSDSEMAPVSMLGSPPCEHMDVVQSVSHSFPVAALIAIPTAVYTQCIHQLTFFIVFLGATRLLLGASNRWLNRRWLLHALSHITGALSVGVAAVHLAENTALSVVGSSLTSSSPPTSPFLIPVSPPQQSSPHTSPLSFFSSVSPLLVFMWCDVIMLILIAITVLQLYRHIR